MKFERKATLASLARGSAVVVGCLVASVPALAQVDVSQLPGQSREEVDPALRTPPVQPRVIDPALLAAPGACAFAGQGMLTLTRIEVTGATLVPRAEIDAALAGLVGQPSDAGVLCTARDRVAALYARHGEALARVDLPEQRMTDGVLVLRVTEGRITETTLDHPEALGSSAALAERYLQQSGHEGATRWAEVERAFLLTREIPGAEVSFALRRAEDGSAEGLEAVAAFGPRRKLDITISGQNLGSEEVGRNGVSTRVDANSFTRFGERTSLVLFSSLSGAQRVAQLMEEVRVGSSGWVLLGDFAYGETEPEGGLAALEIEGRSKVARLGARYPLIKTRDAALDFGMRLEGIDQKNDLGFLRGAGLGLIPLFEENLRVLAFEVDGRWQSIRMPGLATGAGVEIRQGLDAFGASEAGDPLLSREDGQPDFTSARLNLSARMAFNPGARVAPYVQLAGMAQWADGALPAYEEFQVGNFTVGRGFDPGAASGDRAVAAQAELGLDFAAPSSLFTLFGFVDGARLWNDDRLGYDSEPWSAGLGARLRWRTGQLSLTWAAPQSLPFPGATTPEQRVLVTFNHAFSIR